MAPFAVIDLLGKSFAYLVFFAIGLSFGAVLEMAGFADSRRLAGQFYLRNMTVLKVMFTAIVTAMVLVFFTSALGWLDYPRVYVNPTYLASGIAGGLIMGVGFILGGFCPGTSLVALANLKIDALFFFIGVSLGVFAFGETVGEFTAFFYDGSLGRFTLPQWLDASAGFVVVGVVAMALFMFWGSEKLERRFGTRAEYATVSVLPARARRAGAALLLVTAALTLVLGQPSAQDRWERAGAETHALLEERGAYIHPGELIDLAQDRQIRLLMIDVRPEVDYNVFHLVDARRVDLAEVEEGLLSLELLNAPSNTVTVFISNEEALATQAWKRVQADRVLNAYVLEGGINEWIARFRPDLETSEAPPCLLSSDPAEASEPLRFAFPAALGDRQAGTNLDALRHLDVVYEGKVTLSTRKTAGGGCG